ncbi:lysophospholipid acyltransferase family protein [Myroides sp. LJL116]
MKYLTYLIAYPLLWLISILPFPLFYFVSDCLYILIYYVIGYRKKTVRKNIQMTMPELSLERVKQIEKKFFRHLCDIFLETIKPMSISKKQMSKRYTFTNLEEIHQVERQGKSVTLFCAHYANWEWLTILDCYINLQGFAVYKQINNPYFDRFIARIRTRFGSKVVEMRETIRVIRKNEVEGNKGLYAFISDQSPMIGKSNCWQEFMGIEVPIFTGGEALCKKFGMVPYYLEVNQIKRGYYQCTFIPLTKEAEDVSSIPNYELSRRFFQEVEKQIRNRPELYFWTHKRWKHAGNKPANL